MEGWFTKVHSLRVTRLESAGAERKPPPAEALYPSGPSAGGQAEWGAHAGTDPSCLLAVPRARRFSSGGEEDDFDHSMHKVSGVRPGRDA